MMLALTYRFHDSGTYKEYKMTMGMSLSFLDFKEV